MTTQAQVEPHGPGSLRHPLTDREADVRDLLDQLAWLGRAGA